MQKVYVHFEYEVNGERFAFYCNPNAPLASAKEAIFNLLKDLGQIEDSAKKQLEESKPPCEGESCLATL